MFINLVEDLSTEELYVLLHLMMNNSGGSLGRFETIEIDGQIVNVELSHLMTPRKSKCPNHPNRIKFDVIGDNPLGAGGNGVVVEKPVSFKFDPDLLMIMVKDRKRPGKNHYVMKCIQVDENADLTACIKNAEKEVDISTKFYLPHKLFSKSVTVIGRSIIILLLRLPGQNLADYIHERDFRDLQIGRMMSIMMQSSQLVQRLHALGYYHLDIKPHNMLYDHEDNKLYLCDFGTAKPTSVKRLSTISGTPNFIAPEIIRGSDISEKTESYSLGRAMTYFFENHSPSITIKKYEQEVSQLFDANQYYSEFPCLVNLLQLQFRAQFLPQMLQRVVSQMQEYLVNDRISLAEFRNQLQELATQFLLEYGQYLHDALIELMTAAQRNIHYQSLYQILVVAQSEWRDEFTCDQSLEDLLISCDMHFERLVASLMDATPRLASPTSSAENLAADSNVYSPDIELDTDDEELATILTMMG